MPVLNTGLATPARGFTLDQSLRFEDGDSPNLTWTPASAGNQDTWTFSCWVKRGNLGINTSIFSAGTTEGTRFSLRFSSADKIYIINQTSGTYNTYMLTTAVYRDSSAWLNIVLAWDSTQVTAANRTRLYVNGAEIDHRKKGLNEGFEFYNPKERARCGCGEGFTV